MVVTPLKVIIIFCLVIGLDEHRLLMRKVEFPTIRSAPFDADTFKEGLSNALSSDQSPSHDSDLTKAQDAELTIVADVRTECLQQICSALNRERSEALASEGFLQTYGQSVTQVKAAIARLAVKTFTRDRLRDAEFRYVDDPAEWPTTMYGGVMEEVELSTGITPTGMSSCRLRY